MEVVVRGRLLMAVMGLNGNLAGTWEHDWGGNLKSNQPSDLGSFENYSPDKEDCEDATQEDYLDMDESELEK